MSSSVKRGWVKLSRFRARHAVHRNFLIFVSFLVGIISGLAAVVLKMSVQFAEHRVSALNNLLSSHWLSSVFPLIGTGLSLLLLTLLFRNKLNRGVGYIIQKIIRDKGRIDRIHAYGHIMTSALTVSFGGSVGLEAPIVATGAALGSNTGRVLRLTRKDTVLLLCCGTASGIAAVFNSPFAGIIFVLEVLLLDFSIPFFIPLLISTATATVLSQLLYPGKFIFTASSSWNVKAIPFYALLGICCGFVSVYITHVVEFIEGYFEKRKLDWKTWLMAGIPLCLLIFFLPGLYGEGYSTVTQLLHGHPEALTHRTPFSSMGGAPWVIVTAALSFVILKAVCACLTVCAGGNGGIFAPSMITGGVLGFLVAFVLNLSGIYELNTANFIIVAMAGVLAGVMHAPLTAIFLLAEISGGYTLFIPLMIVTALSYFIARKYFRHSVYHKSLVERNILLAPDSPEDHF